MVDTGGNDVDHAERRATSASVHDEAWQQTYEEAQAMTKQRREAGWETAVVPAGHTATVYPDADDAGRLGLVFVIPGNMVAPVEELVATHEPPQFDVYRRTMQGRIFLVVEYFAADEAALFVAGHYERRHADGMVSAAREEGTLNTYLQKLDGTPVASFEHEDFTKFVPDALVQEE